MPKTAAPKSLKGKTSLKKEQQLELYRWMVLNRAFDDKISLLYRRGLVIGAAFSSLGQEATSCASTYALNKDDIIGPMIRNSGSMLVKGMAPRDFLANYMFRVNSPTGGRDGNTHMGDLRLGMIAPVSMLGCTIALCSGFVLAARMRGEKRVALTWIGEGSTSTGEFHEDVNFAAVMKAPMVVIIENNQYAYSTPTSKQCLAERFADKAIGYGIKNAPTIDGNDALEVYETTKKAVDAARRGDGTQIIEAITFRRKGHAEHDPAKYVPKELVEYWEKNDPITRFENYLLDAGYANESWIEKLKAQCRQEVEDAEVWVNAQPQPDPATVAQGVYADQPHPAHENDDFLYKQKFH
ncbi:MAG: thiamine pyrophosphate-dependent dehydrogenase E1 component subunit alpha [Planctomycetaceae bacterium]|nr:thiamine pyrophosphate-dependent dehydrogenase E1 component subunit alpha [Planctomycetaceae bacterium]